MVIGDLAADLTSREPAAVDVDVGRLSFDGVEELLHGPWLDPLPHWPDDVDGLDGPGHRSSMTADIGGFRRVPDWWQSGTATR